MLFTRNEYLKFLAAGDRHIVRETAGRFPGDVWVIKTADNRDIEADLGGFAYSPVHIPDAEFMAMAGSGVIGRDGDVWRAAQDLKRAA
jgi:hypothetical protein